MTNTPPINLGPSASGVIFVLPSPAASTVPSDGSRRESSCATASISSSLMREERANDCDCTVIYSPRGLPNISSPRLSVTRKRVISAPALSKLVHSTPSILLPSRFSRTSSARSVLKFIFSSPFRFRRGAKGKNFFFFSCILAKSMIRLLTV